MLTNTNEKLFNLFPICTNEYGEKIIIVKSKYPMSYLFDMIGMDWEEFKSNYVEGHYPYAKGIAYNLGYNL